MKLSFIIELKDIRIAQLITNTKIYVGRPQEKTAPHLMYKVEKWTRGEHQCESCGFDPVVSYPDLHTKGQSSMMDVDHINSDIKHTPEGEQPNNYQLNL
jgi:hypothetical protein